MRAKVIPILWGALGALLLLLAYTAYVDHQRISAVWQLELARDAAARQAPAK